MRSRHSGFNGCVDHECGSALDGCTFSVSQGVMGVLADGVDRWSAIESNGTTSFRNWKKSLDMLLRCCGECTVHTCEQTVHESEDGFSRCPQPSVWRTQEPPWKRRLYGGRLHPQRRHSLNICTRSGQVNRAACREAVNAWPATIRYTALQNRHCDALRRPECLQPSHFE